MYGCSPRRPYRGAHFATFPAALVEPCILAATSQRGCCRHCGAPWQRDLESWRPTCSCLLADPVPSVVLDPFAGSGTTLMSRRDSAATPLASSSTRGTRLLSEGDATKSATQRRRETLSMREVWFRLEPLLLRATEVGKLLGLGRSKVRGLAYSWLIVRHLAAALTPLLPNYRAPRPGQHTHPDAGDTAVTLDPELG